MTVRRVSFLLPSFAEKEEKKINKTELQAGDIICVTYKKEKTKVDLAYSIEPLHNVKSIQLLKEPQK